MAVKRWVRRLAFGDGRVCSECGSDGEGGAVEDVSGRVWHFRKFPEGPLTKPLPIKCYGKFRLLRKGAKA